MTDRVLFFLGLALGTLAVVLSLAAIAGAQDLTTTGTVTWSPSPDAASGRVLAYRVYVGTTRVAETGQLSALVVVRRGIEESISVSSYGNYDADKDGVIEPGEVGEGAKSAPVLVTAASIHLPGFLGCYVDNTAARALPAALTTGGSTQASCVALAKNAGYRFVGLQWRGECWAGNERRYAAAPVAECSLPCSARPGELCGGSQRNSVYPTGLPPLAPSSVMILR